MCSHCERGNHSRCWGHIGPMTTHPDSLPLCSCSKARHRGVTRRKDKTDE